MKRYTLFAVYGLLSAIMVLPACSKSSDNDPQQPVISITAPSKGQEFANGSTLNIQGSVTDNALHEVRLRISNGSINLYSKTIVAHSMTSYAINENWTISVTATVNAIVTVEAEDLAGHVVNKTVNITINN